jgi:hypothetical protein
MFAGPRALICRGRGSHTEPVLVARQSALAASRPRGSIFAGGLWDPKGRAGPVGLIRAQRPRLLQSQASCRMTVLLNVGGSDRTDEQSHRDSERR